MRMRYHLTRELPIGETERATSALLALDISAGLIFIEFLKLNFTERGMTRRKPHRERAVDVPYAGVALIM